MTPPLEVEQQQPPKRRWQDAADSSRMDSKCGKLTGMLHTPSSNKDEQVRALNAAIAALTSEVKNLRDLIMSSEATAGSAAQNDANQ